MSEELKPCPKCGTAERRIEPDARGGIWHVVDCQCKGYTYPFRRPYGAALPVWRKTPEAATRAWNKARAPKPNYRALALQAGRALVKYMNAPGGLTERDQRITEAALCEARAALAALKEAGLEVEQ